MRYPCAEGFGRVGVAEGFWERFGMVAFGAARALEVRVLATSELKGNNLKRFKDFNLKATARIWS